MQKQKSSHNLYDINRKHGDIALNYTPLQPCIMKFTEEQCGINNTIASSNILKRAGSNGKKGQFTYYYSPKSNHLKNIKIYDQKHNQLKKDYFSISDICSDQPEIITLKKQIQTLKSNMQAIEKQRHEKDKYFQQKILAQINKNNDFKDNLIKDLKKRINQLQNQINDINNQKLSLFEQLKETKKLLNQVNSQLISKQKKINEIFESYERVIIQKQNIIKKMSFFNDQLCLKIIKQQSQQRKQQNYQCTYQHQFTTERSKQSFQKLIKFPQIPQISIEFQNFESNIQSTNTKNKNSQSQFFYNTENEKKCDSNTNKFILHELVESQQIICNNDLYLKSNNELIQGIEIHKILKDQIKNVERLCNEQQAQLQIKSKNLKAKNLYNQKNKKILRWKQNLNF